MTDDQTIQEMISKGVNKQIRLHRERFQKCTFCGVVYNQYNRTLLNCGHFMCNQCYQQMKKCTYPNCSNSSPSIRLFNINKKQQNVSLFSTFGFAISCSGNLREIRKEEKGTNTFGKLIQGDPFIEDYIKQYGPQKIMVVLGSKKNRWLDIKDKTIYELQSKCNLISKSGVYNPFRVYQRYNGGVNK